MDSLPQRVHDMRKELQTWDWIYGQTPEFTNEMKTDFDWGHVVSLECYVLFSSPFLTSPPYRMA